MLCDITFSISSKAQTIVSLFENVVPELKNRTDDADFAAKKIEEWLQNMGVSQKLSDEGFSENDIDKLVELTFETPSLSGLLSIAPVDGNKETVKAIFSESLTAYNK